MELLRWASRRTPQGPYQALALRLTGVSSTLATALIPDITRALTRN